MSNSTALLAKPRNYRCPCNKSYLSYPALFTHIKQKHNGKVLYLDIYRHLEKSTNQRKLTDYHTTSNKYKQTNLFIPT